MFCYILQNLANIDLCRLKRTEKREQKKRHHILSGLNIKDKDCNLYYQWYQKPLAETWCRYLTWYGAGPRGQPCGAVPGRPPGGCPAWPQCSLLPGGSCREGCCQWENREVTLSLLHKRLCRSYVCNLCYFIFRKSTEIAFLFCILSHFPHINQKASQKN